MTIPELIGGLLIPFLGTALGSAMVFLLKGEIKPNLQKALLGFASGVMIAASVWSLLLPSISMATERGQIPWLPAAIGFVVGIGFLLLLDYIIPHLHNGADKPEGRASNLERSTMLVLAVTLHNIPEGMAVGVVFAGALSGSVEMSALGAFVLAIGMAVQNFPEGAVISMPLLVNGTTKGKAFFLGAMSGIVEPIAAVLTILVTSLISNVLPYILAFAAGAMIYVVVEELIPEAQSGEHSNIGTIGVGIGFILMMIFDIAFG